MAVAELIVSRREVLGAACGAPLSLSRHPGLEPGSIFASRSSEGREVPDQVRNDEEWGRALGCFREAEVILAAVEGADDVIFDPALGRFNGALARPLRAPAPDVGALVTKLDLLLVHEVWELAFAETCFVAMRRDAIRLAG
jgi:hypothetical protein